MKPFTILVFVFIASVIIIPHLQMIFWWLRDRRIRKWAESKGFRYWRQGDVETDIAKRFPDFRLLLEGKGIHTWNLIEGRLKNHRFVAFDLQYVPKAKPTKPIRMIHSPSAVIMISETPLKALYIRPEKPGDKISGALGKGDIELESFEFNNRFFVSADDRKWAFDVLHPRMMQHLLDGPNYEIQWGGNFIAVWQNKQYNPLDFEVALDHAANILGLLPDFLKNDKNLRSEFEGGSISCMEQIMRR